MIDMILQEWLKMMWVHCMIEKGHHCVFDFFLYEYA